MTGGYFHYFENRFYSVAFVRSVYIGQLDGVQCSGFFLLPRGMGLEDVVSGRAFSWLYLYTVGSCPIYRYIPVSLQFFYNAAKQLFPIGNNSCYIVCGKSGGLEFGRHFKRYSGRTFYPVRIGRARFKCACGKGDFKRIS